MLAKDGVQAWLVDSDGAEIEHGVSFSDKAHEICAEVVIDAGKVSIAFTLARCFCRLNPSGNL